MDMVGHDKSDVAGTMDTVVPTKSTGNNGVLPPQAVLMMRDNLINDAGRTIPFFVIRMGIWYAFINSTSYVTVNSEADAIAAIQSA